MIRGLLLCILVVPASADTVFLSNGTAIDGVIKARHEQTLELQIGKIGRIFVGLDMIESIEKNDRDGSVSDPALALAGTRRLVEEAETMTAAEPKPAAPQVEKPKDRRFRTKDDVDPELREEIERQMYDYTRESRKFRIRAAKRLTEIGEPALPFLTEVVAHPNPQVRIATMEIFAKNGTDLVLEHALAALEDENEYVRKTANEALVKISGKDFNFRYDAMPAYRQKALEAWQAWYKDFQAQETAAAAEAVPAGDGVAVENAEGEDQQDAASATGRTPPDTTETAPPVSAPATSPKGTAEVKDPTPSK